MRGNTFGKLFSITSFGESHGPAVGVVVDGMIPGVTFSIDDLQKDLDRRAPGKSKGVTSRAESDKAEILSGIYEGKTLGTPIAVIIRNTSQKSSDYDKLKYEYRPGHADKTSILKYNIRDHRGGGRSSGRETIARVIGGHFASLIIPEVVIKAYIKKMGPFEITDKHESELCLGANFGKYNFPDESEEKNVEEYLDSLKKDGSSIGGKIKVVIKNCLPGIGEPTFDKLKADLSKAMMSIGGCVGFSYGIGEKFSELNGQEVLKEDISFGGIEGGISNGQDILMTLTFKPTSTIGEKAKEGRHDPCILPRAVPVVESMAKIVIADHVLRQKAYSWN